MKRSTALRDRLFLEVYLQGKPLHECAKHAGYNGKDKASLAQMGSQVLQRINISMEEICNLTGLTDSYLSQKAKEGLIAEKPVVATFQGKILDERMYPDHAARTKALEIVSRWKGKFVDKVELAGRGGGDIVLNITSSKQKNKKMSINLG